MAIEFITRSQRDELQRAHDQYAAGNRHYTAVATHLAMRLAPALLRQLAAAEAEVELLKASLSQERDLVAGLQEAHGQIFTAAIAIRHNQLDAADLRLAVNVIIQHTGICEQCKGSGRQNDAPASGADGAVWACENCQGYGRISAPLSEGAPAAAAG